MIKEIIDNIQYEISRNTLTKIRYVGDQLDKEIDTLIIPSSINEIPIYKIKAGVFSVKIDSLKNIKKLIISEGIFEIEPNAFEFLNANEVVWPESCTTIPSYCFCKSKIKNISNIQDVEEIEDSAFAFCEKLELIDWPPKCKRIPQMCFFNCKSLKEFDFKNIKAIKSAAFYGAGLQSAVETSAIQEIGNFAFANCTFLKTFIWPDKCSIVPVECFKGSGMEVISSLKNVKVISTYAFVGTLIKKIDLRKAFTNDQEVYIDDNAFDNIKLITFLT